MGKIEINVYCGCFPHIPDVRISDEYIVGLKVNNGRRDGFSLVSCYYRAQLALLELGQESP